MRWRRLATPVIGRKVSARGRWIARGAAAGLLPAVFLIGSIVMTWMPGHSYRGALSPLTPGETALAGRLEAHVRALADAPERGGIGERNLVCAPEALEAAARYIEAAFAAADLAPVAQPFAVGDHAVRNIVAEIRGAARPDEILLIGAHYDSAPGTPGANDNATGVAALIELARTVREAMPARTVRLVAFVNEEPPHFGSEAMGSRVHARAARRRGDRIVGMMALETIGCYRDEPGSQ